MDHTASSPCERVTINGYFLNEWCLPNLGQGLSIIRNCASRQKKALSSVNMDFRIESSLHLPVENCYFPK